MQNCTQMVLQAMDETRNPGLELGGDNAPYYTIVPTIY